MKIIWIFSVVGLIVLGWGGYKEWKQIRKIVKKRDLRKGIIVGLRRTGSTYLYRVGECRVYNWVVAVEDEEDTIIVPTLHTWNIHSRYANMHKEKFNHKEKGKEVDVYYSEQQKKAVIKEKTLGMYINIWGEFLVYLFAVGMITYYTFF